MSSMTLAEKHRDCRYCDEWGYVDISHSVIPTNPYIKKITCGAVTQYDLPERNHIADSKETR